VRVVESGALDPAGALLDGPVLKALLARSVAIASA